MALWYLFITDKQQTRNRRTQQTTAQMAESLLEDMDEVPVLKFGDASVAAPFTSKLASLKSSNICSLI